jgi:hypothetical protein
MREGQGTKGQGTRDKGLQGTTRDKGRQMTRRDEMREGTQDETRDRGQGAYLDRSENRRLWFRDTEFRF